MEGVGDQSLESAKYLDGREKNSEGRVPFTVLFTDVLNPRLLSYPNPALNVTFFSST